MGYTTDFSGSLRLSRPATKEEMDYINLISSTRRMKRDVNKLMEVYEGKHGNPFAKGNTPEEIYGVEGEYFAWEHEPYMNWENPTVIDHDRAPGQINFLQKSTKGQPGLFCQWVITENGTILEWDGNEKFYEYVDWLNYLIDRFFEPWGIKLNGIIQWQGEDSNDMGRIIVNDNVVKTQYAVITFKDNE